MLRQHQRRFPQTWILCLFIACLTGVIYSALHHRVGDYGVESDFYAFYAPTAAALRQGEIVIDDYHPPLYAWLVGLVTLTGLVPGDFEAAVVLAVLSYILIVLATFLMARSLFPGKADVALWAAGLAAVTPTLLDHAFAANIHTFFLALSLLAIAFSLRGRAVETAILVALSIWTRYLLPLSLIPVLFLPRRKAIAAASVAVLAWLALGVFTSEYKGEWCYHLNKLNVAAGLYSTEPLQNPGYWIAQHRSEFQDHSYFTILTKDPPRVLASLWNHVREFSGKLLTEILVFPLGLVALFGLYRQFRNRLRNPLVWWSGAMFLILVFSYWAPQLAVNFIPVMAIAVAAQAAALESGKWRSAAVALSFVLCLAFGAASLWEARTNNAADVRTAALCLKDLPGETVLASDPRVFYYSGKKPGSVIFSGDSVLIRTDYIFDSPFERQANDNFNRLSAVEGFKESTETLLFGHARLIRARLYTPSPPSPPLTLIQE